MFGTAVIVFREMLEAALIVGIVAAATRDVPKRGRWIAAGILSGLLGAAIVAGFTDRISQLASGVGQEIFNAGVLGIAVLMLGWHSIWMSSHGAKLAANARNIGNAIRDGSKERQILLVVIGVAVLREGSETVLFLYGIAASETTGASGMLLGGLVGALAGVVVGYALYAGLLKIPMRWFFSATNTLVLLLAAGMASQAARFLIQANLVPSLASPLWDTSAFIEDKSIVGRLLHGLIGYDSRPAGMQLVFYVVVMAAILTGMSWVKRNRSHVAPKHSTSNSHTPAVDSNRV
ncbi:MAG TPA: FTR1 family protein [Methylophilaceae bacterium]